MSGNPYRRIEELQQQYSQQYRPLPDPILCEADAQLAEDRRSVFQRALDDSLTLSPAEFDDKWRVPFGRKETVTLAVESARRWARRTDLSPELRLRRIWQVLETAIREETK